MLGAPIALVIGALAPDLWLIGAVWAVAMIVLILVDAMIAPSGGKLRIHTDAPRTAAIGAGDIPVALTMDFGGRAPRAVEVDIETNALLTARMTMTPRAAGDRAQALRALAWTARSGMARADRTHGAQDRADARSRRGRARSG
jgi:uncharacterized protein (DUF58 family)